MGINILGKHIAGKESPEELQARREQIVARAKKRQRREELRAQKEQRRIEKEREQFARQQEIRQRDIDRAKSEAELMNQRALKERSKTRVVLQGKRRTQARLAPITGALKGVKKGVIALKGGSSSHSQGSTRGRAIYQSTSHGLKRVYPGDEGYYSSVPQGNPPPRIKSDDDWGDASAFSSW